MGAIMPAVLPMYGAPASRRAAGPLHRVPRCALPALGSMVVAALATHLLVDLIGRAADSGPAGLLSVGVGIMAVSVVLAPFAVLLAARAHRAWGEGAADPRRRGRPVRVAAK